MADHAGGSQRSPPWAARLGAGLLLITPPGAFEKVVPVLIGGAGAVLLFQPQLRAAVLRKAGEDHRGGPVVLAGILAVAV